MPARDRRLSEAPHHVVTRARILRRTEHRGGRTVLDDDPRRALLSEEIQGSPHFGQFSRVCPDVLDESRSRHSAVGGPQAKVAVS